MIGRQVRSRRDRSIALGAGILVASVSFSLLTAAASTSQLEVHGTVDAASRPAYDILVRPKGAADAIETQDNLVRDNYLAGTFGGISTAQWQKILSLPNVTVAAPIANIGYVIPTATVVLPVEPVSTSDPHQLYRVSLTWKAANGLSSYPGGTDYIYYTPTDQIKLVEGSAGGFAVEEVVPGQAKPVAMCPGLQYQTPPQGLNTGSEESVSCFSGQTPTVNTGDIFGLHMTSPGDIVSFSFPMMLSAVDPIQEAKLVGLPQTMVSGSYLSETQGLSAPVQDENGLPVIVASRNYLDDSLTADVQQLNMPSTVNPVQQLANPNYTQVESFLRGLSGPVVERPSLSAQASYATLLEQLLHPPTEEYSSYVLFDGVISDYWTSSGVQYRDVGGAIAPLTTSNPTSIWDQGLGLTVPQTLAPPGNDDTQFQKVTVHQGNPTFDFSLHNYGEVALKPVGEFDPNKLPGFNPLSAVPLETYYPPVVTGANAPSNKALKNQPLGPTMNLGGYVAQPPLLLTSLAAMEQMLSPSCYLHPPYVPPGIPCMRYPGADAAAPISAIRVRVANVHGFEPLDRARILAVTTAIKKATGLEVDITAGSSPTTVDVDLPAGCCGEPALTVAEGWVRKGAALVVLNAVDAKSLVLFVLVLVVCVLFLANGAYASVRSRRTELGVLACLGWGRAALFRLVLGELALVGLATGVIGAALAEILALALRLDLPWWHALLVVPIALGLACVAGMAPAYAATRGRPLDAVYSVPGGSGRHRAVHHVSGIAGANLLRRPARLITGALGLFIGVAAFAVLLAVQLAFQGQVVGTALGNLVSVQVRSVDLIAAVLALLLGAFSVADVLAVNLRDRAGEQAVLAATGWRPATLFRLAFTEGMVVGIVGAFAGGAVGLGLAAILTGSAIAVIPASVLAAVIGLILVGAVLMVPAWQASQTPPAAALAED
jgi:ABC-type lipoprotein release transport system permease subunit